MPGLVTASEREGSRQLAGGPPPCGDLGLDLLLGARDLAEPLLLRLQHVDVAAADIGGRSDRREVAPDPLLVLADPLALAVEFRPPRPRGVDVGDDGAEL